MIKNPRIQAWRRNHPWPSRYHLFERFDVVKTAHGLLGIITSLMSNATMRVDFLRKPDDRKTSFSFYRPESLTMVQKGSSQTWIPAKPNA